MSHFEDAKAQVKKDWDVIRKSNLMSEDKERYFLYSLRHWVKGVYLLGGYETEEIRKAVREDVQKVY